MLITILFSSCATYYGDKNFAVSDELFYTAEKKERQSAIAYIPEGKGPFPGVVLVHGGGWNSRDKEDMRLVAKSLASHGMSVLSINYRFAPENIHPAPVEDLELALSFFKLHAKKFKLNFQKIGLWGYSAGSHTVAFYALSRAKDPQLAVQAVVAGGGPFDFASTPDSRLVKKYMGSKMRGNPQLYYQASPLYRVTSEAPPFYLYHALKDESVDFQRTVDFKAKLQSNGVKVKSYAISYWGHVTAFIFSKQAVKKGVKFLMQEL